MADNMIARKDMKRGDLFCLADGLKRWAVVSNSGQRYHSNWPPGRGDLVVVGIDEKGCGVLGYHVCSDPEFAWYVVGRAHFMTDTDIIESIELFDNDAVKPVAPTPAQQCTCGITELMRYGCRCGGV